MIRQVVTGIGQAIFAVVMFILLTIAFLVNLIRNILSYLLGRR